MVVVMMLLCSGALAQVKPGMRRQNIRLTTLTAKSLSFLRCDMLNGRFSKCQGAKGFRHQIRVALAHQLPTLRISNVYSILIDELYAVLA